MFAMRGFQFKTYDTRLYQRKSPAPEAEAGSLAPKDKVARMSKVELARAVGVLWRALHSSEDIPSSQAHMIKSPVRSGRTIVSTRVKLEETNSRSEICSDRIGRMERALELLNEAMTVFESQ